MGSMPWHDRGGRWQMAEVLFLDDMSERHRTFGNLVDRMYDDVRVWRCYTAESACAALTTTEFDQVFLDHDLSEEDIMVAPGAPSRVPTGMAVVDHILTMERPPREVFVHTCNPPAADEMVRRLREHPASITVHQLPFPELIARMGRRP
jgi:hypothetical protein